MRCLHRGVKEAVEAEDEDGLNFDIRVFKLDQIFSFQYAGPELSTHLSSTRNEGLASKSVTLTLTDLSAFPRLETHRPTICALL